MTIDPGVGPSSQQTEWTAPSSYTERAPRRFILTKTIRGGDIKEFNPLSRFSPGGGGGNRLLTFCMTIPIEAPCYAARLLFRNCFREPILIHAAAITPTSSYGDFVPVSWQEGGRKSYAPATGGAANSTVYFDHQGAGGTIAADAINFSGTARSAIVPPNIGNIENIPLPYTPFCSDFVPVHSISRNDGGIQHLLFVTVTLAGGHVDVVPNLKVFNNDAVANRGRYVCSGCAWTGGKDYTHDMTAGGSSGGWTSSFQNPIWGLQYVTDRPGIQIAMTGDSLSCSPTNDTYSNALLRASWDISTPITPIEVVNLAWPTSRRVYTPVLMNAAPIIRPSVVSLQPLSRNDGYHKAQIFNLIGNAMSVASALNSCYGTIPLLFSPGAEPSFHGDPKAEDAYVETRSRLASCGLPLIDAPSILCREAEPWNYLSGYSDDDCHPNSAAAEATVPLARDALRRLLS